MKLLLVVALAFSYTLGFQLGVNLVKDCERTNDKFTICSLTK